MTELKPCPFCGEHPKRNAIIDKWYLACENEKCLIQPMTPAYKSKGAYVRAWNRRFDNMVLIDKALTIEAYTEADVISAYNEGVAYGAEQVVQHGRWEDGDREGFFHNRGNYICSNCKSHTGLVKFNYCPNCGTKMDGGVE